MHPDFIASSIFYQWSFELATSSFEYSFSRFT